MLGAEETSSYLFEKLGLDIAECFDEFGRVKMNLISADTLLRGDKWEKDEAYRFRRFETYQSLRYYAWEAIMYSAPQTTRTRWSAATQTRNGCILSGLPR